MKCQYCKNDAVWVENKEIYGKNYGKSYMCWLCKNCDAYVGCHNNTKEPLGNLANKELREKRKMAKNLWIQRKLGNWECDPNKKRLAYADLNILMGKEFHFGNSTIKECEIIIDRFK